MVSSVDWNEWWDPARGGWSLSGCPAILGHMSNIEYSARMLAVELWRKMDMYCAIRSTKLRSTADRSIDVTLLCAFTALSTVGSIIQQFHYATSWVDIKQAQFEKAIQSLTEPSLAFGGAAQKTDVALFYIRKP